MARKGPKKKTKNEVFEPGTLAAFKVEYCHHLKIKHFSPHTIRVRCNDMDRFIGWCNDYDVTMAIEITPAILERYRSYIYHYKKKDNKPLSLQTQVHRLVALRTFFKWLTKKSYILYNPASELELPRLGKKLPGNLLTVQEVELIINQPDINEPIGLRDRAILETFYSTGIRRSELINLKLYDLRAGVGTLMVRSGKGRKDRVVPVGDRALAWIDKYLDNVRPQFKMEPDEDYVFLTVDGDPLSQNRLSDLGRTYVKAADINKTGSCHIFRHAMATHMLENGADIRVIQAILGHENLQTTEIYTHVSIGHLQAVHRDTHPAKLNRDTTKPTKENLLIQLQQEVIEDTE